LEIALDDMTKVSSTKIVSLEAEIAQLNGTLADVQEALSVTRTSSSQKIGELETALKMSKTKFINHQGINPVSAVVLDSATSPLKETVTNAGTQSVDTNSPVISPGERVTNV
jgi:hypothetical protein